MHCPVCGTEYASFERKCARCDADLIDDSPDADLPADDLPTRVTPDARIVSVFKTSDPAVLPLAKMALEGEGIEYFVKHANRADSLQWMMSQDPTNRPMAVEIHVGSDVAGRARDLLVDLETAAPLLVAPAAADTAATPAEPPAAVLEDAVTGDVIGVVTESDLQEITSRLEEASPREYFITGETVDMLQQAGARAGLVDLLRRAVGADASGRAVRWVVRSQ